MRIIVLFVSGVVGICSIILGVSLFLGNNVFADITFDTELETQWYRGTSSGATVTVIPEPISTVGIIDITPPPPPSPPPGTPPSTDSH